MAASPFNLSHGDVNRLPHDEDSTDSDWLADDELTEEQRARCHDVATPRSGHPRSGHEQRRTWPADELRGVLDGERP
jgi:hypothetical protein